MKIHRGTLAVFGLWPNYHTVMDNMASNFNFLNFLIFDCYRASQGVRLNSNDHRINYTSHETVILLHNLFESLNILLSVITSSLKILFE